MQGVPQKRTVQVSEAFTQEALSKLPTVQAKDHPEHSMLWTRIECDAINRQILKAVNGLVSLCAARVQAAEVRFNALHAKYKRQRQEYANLQRAHQTTLNELRKLKKEET